MTLIKEDKPALILIDIQKGFDDIEYWGGHRNNPNAEIEASKLLNFWRAHQLPIIHVKHCSTDPNSRLAEGTEGNDFKDLVRPLAQETIIKKKVNSCFIGTDLKEQLDNAAIKKVVLLGLTTNHCVSTTTRMAGNFGYETFVVSDATATFDRIGVDGKKYSAEIMHETALASLNDEFATILTAEEIIKQLS